MLLLPLSGCNYLAFLGYAFSPELQEKTVEAEFDQLPGRRVAVVMFTQPSVDFAYPRAKVDLSEAVAYDLRQNVKDLTVVPVSAVTKYQRENLGWDSLPRRELAKKLGADYVMHIGLEEYSMADSNSGMFRARITADINLYAAAPAGGAATDDSPVWTGRLRVVSPEDTARAIDDRKARGESHAMFAKLLGRKFHQHKLSAEEQR